MQLRYTLTTDDLTEVVAQLGLRAQHRNVMSPTHVLYLSVVVGGLLVLASRFLGMERPHAFPLDHSLANFTNMAAAALILMPLLPLFPRARLQRSRHFRRYRRFVGLFGLRCVPGVTSLGLDHDRLHYTDGRGRQLEVPWGRVREVLVGSRVVVLELRRTNRVLAIPKRAFESSVEAEAFLALLEERTQSPCVQVGFDLPPPVAPKLRDWVSKRARLALLSTTLGFLTLLLLRIVVVPWWRSPARTNPPGSVVVYSAEWCGSCERLRGCLDESGIEYRLRDIELSVEARQEWRAVGTRSIPVTLVGSEIVIGVGARMSRVMAEAGYEFRCPAG